MLRPSPMLLLGLAPGALSPSGPSCDHHRSFRKAFAASSLAVDSQVAMGKRVYRRVPRLPSPSRPPLPSRRWCSRLPRPGLPCRSRSLPWPLLPSRSCALSHPRSLSLSSSPCRSPCRCCSRALLPSCSHPRSRSPSCSLLSERPRPLLPSCSWLCRSSLLPARCCSPPLPCLLSLPALLPGRSLPSRLPGRSMPPTGCWASAPLPLPACSGWGGCACSGWEGRACSCACAPSGAPPPCRPVSPRSGCACWWDSEGALACCCCCLWPCCCSCCCCLGGCCWCWCCSGCSCCCCRGWLPGGAAGAPGPCLRPGGGRGAAASLHTCTTVERAPQPAFTTWTAVEGTQLPTPE